MKEKLIINDYNDVYRIVWYIYEDDFGEGATLGQQGDAFTEKSLNKCDPEEWEHIMATLVASRSPGVKRDRIGYFWPTQTQAKTTLKLIKQALHDKEKPWPAWALQAKTAGWKPPRGWKP